MSLSADLFLSNGYVDPLPFSEAAYSSLVASVTAARRTRSPVIRTFHLFMGLMNCPDATVRRWARQAGLDLAGAYDHFARVICRTGRPAVVRLHREFLSDLAIGTLWVGRERCEEQDRSGTTPADLLWAVLAGNGRVTSDLARQGLPAPFLRVLLADAERTTSSPDRLPDNW